jgi:hypothetical protein
MEDQTAFELNKAIQRWRENLANSPAFHRGNLNELESHLRDSVAALQTRGFSAEEAFLVATRRIGQSRQLESEFSKLNRGTIWLGRAMWMLIGLQVWPFFDRLMSGIAGNLFAMGSKSVPHYPSGIAWPIFVSALLQLPALIAAVWLTWTVLRTAGKFGEWIATKLPRRSFFVLCCIAACVLAFLLYALLILLVMGQWKFSGAATMVIISRSRNFITPLRAVGFAVLTLVIARKLLGLHKIMADQTPFDLRQTIQTWRESLARFPAFRCEDLNELESHLSDSVATLQTRGLSAQEGFLIATHRIGPGWQLEPEFDKINRNTIWLGRAMWMLIGIQVWPFFDRLMSGIAGNLFALGWSSVHHSPSAVGDAWPVFFSSLIQLPALVVAVWLSWRVLRNSERFGQWVATKLPGRSSFVLCCIAASVLAYLLHALVLLLPWGWHRLSGDPMRVTSYIDSSRTFVAVLRVIGFVILTLLLARKQFVPEKA